MQKQFSIILLLVIFSCTAYGQNDSNKYNKISFTTGLNQGYFKDLNFSPLNHTISGISYSLVYTRIKKNSLIIAALDFNNNKVQTIQPTGFPKSEYLQGRLNIAYLKKINKISNTVDFFLGVNYQSNINYINFFEEESTTFLVAHSLGISFSAKYIINPKHSLFSTFSMPLLTLMIRPPYAGFNEELDENLDKPIRLITNGYFTSINKYISPFFSLQYEYNLTNRFSLLGVYQLNYQKLKKNDAFTTFQNQIRLGINYNF